MERRIVLFGHTGSGKSATGNMILGKKVFEGSPSGSSVTFKTKFATAKIDDRQVVVVDTPGLFVTERGNDQILREITRCVSLSAPGPHALILVIKGGDRVTKHIQLSADILMGVFGDGALRHMIVLFTRRDDIEYDGSSVDDFIKSLPDEMRRVMEKCGNRYLAFNNRAQSEDVKQTQVRELMDMIDGMDVINEGQFYTNNYYREVEKIVDKRVKELGEKFNLDEAALRQIVREGIQNDKEVGPLRSALNVVNDMASVAVGIAGAGVGTVAGGLLGVVVGVPVVAAALLFGVVAGVGSGITYVVGETVLGLADGPINYGYRMLRNIFS